MKPFYTQFSYNDFLRHLKETLYTLRNIYLTKKKSLRVDYLEILSVSN